MSRIKLSIIAPVYNEESVIGEFYRVLCEELAKLSNIEPSMVFVLDRSTDASLDILTDIAKSDSRVKVLSMSSRFGHQPALLAGMEYSRDADCVIMMDSDLQHPPSLIGKLIEEYVNGSDIVFTVRVKNEDSGLIRRLLGRGFYKAINYLSNISISRDAADFRLVSKRVVSVICDDFRERNLFLRGVFSWVGFTQSKVEFQAGSRTAGVSKYPIRASLALAWIGVLSFSTKPLRAGIFVGTLFGILSVLMLLVIVGLYFIDSSTPPGWTTLIAVILLTNGVQMLLIGILGMYIGGIYQEVQSRPRYIVDKVVEKDD